MHPLNLLRCSSLVSSQLNMQAPSSAGESILKEGEDDDVDALVSFLAASCTAGCWLLLQCLWILPGAPQVAVSEAQGCTQECPKVLLSVKG